MIRRIRPFSLLEIETSSFCNRHCATCLRNTIPERDSVADRFEQNLLPMDDIRRIIDEASSMGFRGEICLSHYNEPLLDPRIADIARLVKESGVFSRCFFGSNGDHLTDELAASLDGIVDYIGFALYMNEPVRSKREEWIRGCFKRTSVTVSGGPPEEQHMVTHFCPLVDVNDIARRSRGRPCNRPIKRMIVNHAGNMLLCCEDVIGRYGLGTIRDGTLEQLWYSDVHQDIVLSLQKPMGRAQHPYCASCPRD